MNRINGYRETSFIITACYSTGLEESLEESIDTPPILLYEIVAWPLYNMERRDEFIVKGFLLSLVCLVIAVTGAYGETAGAKDDLNNVSVLDESPGEFIPETKYVKESFTVMARSGPDLGHRIVAMPISGTAVEILEVLNEEWVRVRLPNENEGFMLRRFLVPGPPKKQVIARLKAQNHELRLKTKTLPKESAQLKNESKKLARDLSKQTKTIRSLRESYEALKTECKEYLALKASNEKVQQQLTARTKQVAELKRDVKDQRNSRTRHWLMAGAGVIVVGLVLGYVSGRPKRRSPLL